LKNSSPVTRLPKGRLAEPRLSSLPDSYESGLVDIFADLAELFGNPKSYGQIYGLLFANEEPLSMEEISRRLDISQGSTSQGLRQLEAFGAIVKKREDGDRQALYTAKLEMKLLISGFLKERVIPRLESTESRVKALRDSLSASPSGLPGAVSASLRLRSQTQVSALSPAALSAARFRLNRLAKWHRSARTILPLARKILGGS
jgi:DNA-binding transcriptional regulator GbsR (MarR family)